MPQLSRENIAPRVITVLRDQLNFLYGVKLPNGITDDTSICKDLGADSLDYVEIAIACEDEFKVELADVEMDEVKTVGELIDLIMAQSPEVSLA